MSSVLILYVPPDVIRRRQTAQRSSQATLKALNDLGVIEPSAITADTQRAVDEATQGWWSNLAEDELVPVLKRLPERWKQQL